MAGRTGVAGSTCSVAGANARRRDACAAAGLGRERSRPGRRADILVRSRRAVRRLIWEPNELGLGRAYVAGELDMEGDVFEVLGRR